MDSSHNIQQLSPEWIAARIGKVTASRVADIMARTKSGYSTSRQNYMAELICERLTGSKAEGFTNAAMQWGLDNEASAKATYAFMTNAEVLPAGFDLHPVIADFGASPDGYVGSDGLVEIKCPLTATHLETLLEGYVDAKYQTQMQVQMACTGRQWCDFISYDPRLPVDMQLFVKRIPRDASRIAEIETEVRGFLTELAAKMDALKAKFGVAA